MQTKKIRVAILFGGKSAEHNVSILSAKNVCASLDKDQYDVTLIGIDMNGQWHLITEQQLLNAPSALPLFSPANQLVNLQQQQLITVQDAKEIGTIDVVFPVLHGPYGEDGSMQGFLKTLGIPFVGSDVLGSAVGMDKDVMKRLLRDAGLPIAKFLVFKPDTNINFEEINQQLGLPLFVKPANLGSSVGVTKVHNEHEFQSAIKKAFSFDTKILIEEYIQGREIECAVLGNDHPRASLPGEIVPQNQHQFYDYDAKYIDESGARLKAPVELPDEHTQQVQELSIKVFQTLCLDGMARIDFFLTSDGKWYVNEANTIPGFTHISMYPALWETSGLCYTKLIDQLIQLAIEKHKKQHSLQTSRE